MRMGSIDVGRIGIWTWILDNVPSSQAAEYTVEGWRILAPHLLN